MVACVYMVTEQQSGGGNRVKEQVFFSGGEELGG